MTHLRLSSNNVLRSCSHELRSHNLQQQKNRQLNFKTGVLRAVHSIVALTCDTCPGNLGRNTNKPPPPAFEPAQAQLLSLRRPNKLAGLTGAGAAAPLPLPLPKGRNSAPIRPRDAEAPHTAVSQKRAQLVKECTWSCLHASLAFCCD